MGILSTTDISVATPQLLTSSHIIHVPFFCVWLRRQRTSELDRIILLSPQLPIPPPRPARAASDRERHSETLLTEEIIIDQDDVRSIEECVPRDDDHRTQSS